MLRHLREIHDELDTRPALELYHEAQHYLQRGPSRCTRSASSTWRDRARLDDLYYAIAQRACAIG